MASKKEKKRRKRIRSFVLLLFLTIIMFGTATYAWFTANRIVTIQNLDVHVEASEGLQISTDAATWKSVITNADITTGAYNNNVNQVPATVTAVSTNGEILTDTGRMKMYSSEIGTNASTGTYTITTHTETEAQGNNGKFIAFDIFLRVSSNKTIYLTSDSSVVHKDTATNTTDKGLKNAARVAFVKLGEAAATTPSANIVTLNQTTSSTTPIIWEPNSDTHSSIVTSSVAAEYEVTIPASGAVPYWGVASEFTTLDLKSIVNGTLTQAVDPETEEVTATYTEAMTPDIVTTAANPSYSQAFTLNEGVTKFRVYMWIEGQDIDCESNATGSDISFNVQLSTSSSASGE